jgi:hypothetical protein
MRAARWSVSIGSIALLATGVLHGTKFSELGRMLSENHVKPPLDGISRASWLIFSTEMMAVAVIAFMAGRMERGRGILFVCAATLAANAAFLVKYLGMFIGVYLTISVMILFFVGALLPDKARAQS